MDAVTYPDRTVAQLVQERVIPVRIRSNTQEAADFNVHWTPTVVMLDAEGKEHHRTIGWLSPDEMTAAVLLGIAKVHFDRGEQGQVQPPLGELLDRYPQSSAAPEALYLSGITRYKQTRDLKALRAVYEKLRADYPSSEWTERASVYETV